MELEAQMVRFLIFRLKEKIDYSAAILMTIDSI